MSCKACKWGGQHERSYELVAGCQREDWAENGSQQNPCWGRVVFNRDWDFGGCRYFAPPTDAGTPQGESK